jgi:hypothetical protein
MRRESNGVPETIKESAQSIASDKKTPQMPESAITWAYSHFGFGPPGPESPVLGDRSALVGQQVLATLEGHAVLFMAWH